MCRVFLNVIPRRVFPVLKVIATTRYVGGYLIAAGAVGVAVAARAGLEPLGSFYYLPAVPAVVLTAVLSRRVETAFAVALAIIANVLFVQRDDMVDTWSNGILFASVSWGIAEICWGLRASQQTASDLWARLARRDAMLNTILASVPVVTLDRSGLVCTITPAALQLLDISEAQVKGHNFSEVVEAFSLADIETSGSPPIKPIWTGTRGGGMKFPLNIDVGLMPNAAGNTYAVLCLTDLSQAHAADARSRELHAQLNRVWRLNSLGEMAASLAHELNQPLTAAVTYLHSSEIDVERAGLPGSSAGRNIALAKSQLLRAGEIIRRMRELLAHETRSLSVEHVAPMVADLKGVFSMIERAGGVSIEVDIDDLNDQVQAERIQVQQALLNLVRNAVEALAGQACPRVRIAGGPVSEEFFELRVEDNGTGIAPDQMDSIFRPLTTTKTGGMGLGLSVTRTIVESHGGILKVERSELGGACFSFCLVREQGMNEA